MCGRSRKVKGTTYVVFTFHASFAEFTQECRNTVLGCGAERLLHSMESASLAEKSREDYSAVLDSLNGTTKIILDTKKKNI